MSNRRHRTAKAPKPPVSPSAKPVPAAPDAVRIEAQPGSRSAGPRDHNRKAVAGWAAGVASTVVATVVITYLQVWGLPSSGSTPATASIPVAVAQSGTSAKIGSLQTVNLAVDDGYGTDVGLDVTVHNTGTALAVLYSLNLTIVSSLRLSPCYSQGDLGATGKYTVTLPGDPPDGTVLKTEISQQAGPDEADRFFVSMKLDGSWKNSVYVLYRLDITIDNDGTPAADDIGTALLSLPLAPATDDFDYWGTSSPTRIKELKFLGSAGVADVVKCMHANTAALKAFLGQPGSRPDQLTAIANDLR